MSAIASFNVLLKRDFEEFCKIGKLSRVDWTKSRPHLVPVMASRKKLTPDEQKEDAYFQSLWNYLNKHSSEPYSFPWSGWVLSDLILILKEKRKVDLYEFTLETHVGVWEWAVFDRKIKDKYCVLLDSAKFDEVELKSWYMQVDKERDEEILRAEAKIVSRAELKKDREYFQKQLSQFSDAGRAMMDGVKVLHNYLKVVDDNHVVLLHIG